MSDTILTWNYKSPWPVSFDGKRAFRCNKAGQPNTRGRYICWEVQEQQSMQGATWTTPKKRIARLIRPEEKIRTLDHVAAIRESYDNNKYDLMLPKSAARMRTRLTKIFAKLGVGFLDAQQHTFIQRINAPCCWAQGRKENEEYIFIHPYFLMQRITWARFLILRAIAHRALSRGRKHLKDRQLRQLVFDICIHRILAANTTGKPNASWRKFMLWIYPEESRESVLALCNASLSDQDVRHLESRNPIYAQIWRQLYELQYGDFKYTNPQTGKQLTKKLRGVMPFEIQRINPDDLYFRLKGQLTEEDRRAMQPIGYEEKNGAIIEDGDVLSDNGLNPFGIHSRRVEIDAIPGATADLQSDVNDIASDAAARMERAVRKWMVPRRFQFSNFMAWSDCRTNFWDRWVKKPEDLTDPALEEYAKRIRTEKYMNNVIGNVVEGLTNDVSLDPYPTRLTEEGQVLAVCGFTPEHGYPFYHNMHGPQGKRRVVTFFDLSPSMVNFYAYMAYMCECFEDHFDMVFARNEYGDPGVMTFAGSVRVLTEQERRQMKRGLLKAGDATSFDSVIEYCCNAIATEDVDAVIIFTDGESYLSDDNLKLFNNSGKRMYRIYFQPDHPQNRGRKVESPLDELNGESYSITAPPTDVF